ncbi:unknown [Clostridium sp. CAG:1013]|nr:unknown [Clostridium sp. CAG:1013]
MGHQHRVLPAEIEELLEGFFLFGSTLDHLVGDGGKLGDLLRDGPLRVHKGVEPVGDLPIMNAHSADLRDPVILGAETGGLQVKADKVAGQRMLAVAGDSRHQVVDKIGLRAVKHLKVRAAFPNVLHGVHGFGEGLGHTVVSDGNGLLSPLVGLLDQVRGGAHAVHIGHVGM